MKTIPVIRTSQLQGIGPPKNMLSPSMPGIGSTSHPYGAQSSGTVASFGQTNLRSRTTFSNQPPISNSPDFQQSGMWRMMTTHAGLKESTGIFDLRNTRGALHAGRIKKHSPRTIAILAMKHTDLLEKLYGMIFQGRGDYSDFVGRVINCFPCKGYEILPDITWISLANGRISPAKLFALPVHQIASLASRYPAVENIITNSPPSKKDDARFVRDWIQSNGGYDTPAISEEQAPTQKQAPLNPMESIELPPAYHPLLENMSEKPGQDLVMAHQSLLTASSIDDASYQLFQTILNTHKCHPRLAIYIFTNLIQNAQSANTRALAWTIGAHILTEDERCAIQKELSLEGNSIAAVGLGVLGYSLGSDERHLSFARHIYISGK